MIGFGLVKNGRPVPRDAEIVRFPGGEQHINSAFLTDDDWLVMLRGANSDELVQMMMFANLANGYHKRVHAILPYLPGARQDRGLPFGAKVYADIVNSCEFSSVWTVDPHSDVMPALINNLIVVPTDMPGPFENYDGIIAPDAGAAKRAHIAAERLGVPVYQAWKKRDFATGRLSGFGCEPLPGGKYVIVDDICDGGGTFIGLAQHLGLPKENLDLCVTHGIFSAGFDTLVEHFGRITFGDTWQDVDNETLERYRALDRIRLSYRVADAAARWIHQNYGN